MLKHRILRLRIRPTHAGGGSRPPQTAPKRLRRRLRTHVRKSFGRLNGGLGVEVSARFGEIKIQRVIANTWADGRLRTGVY